MSGVQHLSPITSPHITNSSPHDSNCLPQDSNSLPQDSNSFPQDSNPLPQNPFSGLDIASLPFPLNQRILDLCNGSLFSKNPPLPLPPPPDSPTLSSDSIDESVEDPFDDKAVKDAMKQLGTSDGRINGLIPRLFPHQVIGVSWMVGQEKRSSTVKGGILADDMGLGKVRRVISIM
jgi:SNF2 family DNA or RNA helicase